MGFWAVDIAELTMVSLFKSKIAKFPAVTYIADFGKSHLRGSNIYVRSKKEKWGFLKRNRRESAKKQASILTQVFIVQDLKSI